jgi:hypothetical protein
MLMEESQMDFDEVVEQLPEEYLKSKEKEHESM